MLYTFDVVDKLINRAALPAVGVIDGLRLGSHFQPVFSFAHGRAVGYEALLRATDATGRSVAPLDALRRTGDPEQAVLVDRLSRAVHLRNFASQPTDDEWLFLNTNPGVSARRCGTHGNFFGDMLQESGIPAHRIVVEILESAVQDETLLQYSVDFFRGQGTLIAIDDFGAGHSNFDRIWRLRPDIVKLDRSLLVRASADPVARRMIPAITAMLHEIGSLVLMEGVEDQAQAMLALDAEIDLVQGYYFARPSPALRRVPADGASFDRLFGTLAQFAKLEHADYLATMLPYGRTLRAGADALLAGGTLEAAMQPFLALPLADSCYLLDQRGRQVNPGVFTAQAIAGRDPRFQPIAENVGSNFARRQYYRRAVASPGRVQMTSPYLSFPSATLCVTVSLALDLPTGMQVLCGDIRWDEELSPTDRSIDTALRRTGD